MLPVRHGWRRAAVGGGLLLFAAVLAVSPLLRHGCSCGQDLPFHLQSWMDAAAQMRAGIWYPRWTASAAWNSGEPRFVFYPPLSWMAGALVTMVVPAESTPAVLTGAILALAGVAFFVTARRMVGRGAALVGAAVYLANPYMLFTALWRGDFGELTAAAWAPLLVGALLERRPRVMRVAVPLALMWLSNVPAGAIALYLVAGVAVVRVAQRRKVRPVVAACAGGGLVGLALTAFYLVPAVMERRLVRMEDAFPPGLRPLDQLLFRRGGWPLDRFHTRLERVALEMIVATVLSVAAGLVLSRGAARRWRVVSVGALALVVGVLLTPVAEPFWRFGPELRLVMFPWRLLFLLGVVMALAVALVWERVFRRRAWIAAVCAAPMLAGSLGWMGYRANRQV